MNILIPDIDKYIANILDLQSLANLLLVNKFFHGLIITKPVMKQWKHIHSMNLAEIDDIFIETCGLGYLECAIYLVNENDIDIHTRIESAFKSSCEKRAFKNRAMVS